MSWQTLVFNFFSYAIIFYSVFILTSYILIGVYSIGETKDYLNKNSFTDYNAISSSPHAPSISLIAPAYNEGETIIENIRSLLSLHYNNLEVIIVNDGSKDDSLQKLIDKYDLYKKRIYINQKIQTKEIKDIYVSKKSIYKKLIVVDKFNGGKADALNTGVNISNNDYIVCVDVDCILEQDSLLKLIKPFLEATNKRVIATGGVVRIANNCIVEDGRLVTINLPDKFLPLVQTLEYIRAFLLGRMAWSRLNGLLLISGAFGAFDKEIVIKAGGYNTKTVGEDIELVVRMRRYMEENDYPYSVDFIPDPLCWTEAPESLSILGRQRNRWTRGTIETLKIHRKMFFNSDYGILGLLSYPYWFFFEFLAPIIEALGMLCFIFFVYFELINWPFFIELLLMIYSFGILYSTFGILMETLTYNQYSKNSSTIKLLLTAFLEPIFFHPFIVFSAIRGNIDHLRNKKGWGVMVRNGFSKKK